MGREEGKGDRESIKKNHIRCRIIIIIITIQFKRSLPYRSERSPDMVKVVQIVCACVNCKGVEY